MAILRHHRIARRGVGTVPVPYSRAHPLNPLHRIDNPSQHQKTNQMSQSRVGESNDSSNNNSLNNNSLNNNFFDGTSSFNNSNISNNTNSFNNVCNVNNFGVADERAEILAWLSILEPRIRHENIRAHRVKNVGSWLFRTAEYQNWFEGIRAGESDNSALFCHGDPGVGKTYIR